MSLPALLSSPTMVTFLPFLANANAQPIAGFLLPHTTTLSPTGFRSLMASCREMMLSPSPAFRLHVFGSGGYDHGIRKLVGDHVGGDFSVELELNAALL